jgi:hypothetical protein
MCQASSWVSADAGEAISTLTRHRALAAAHAQDVQIFAAAGYIVLSCAPAQQTADVELASLLQPKACSCCYA